MKTLSNMIAEARSTHDIRDVLGLRSNEKVIVCPLPHHTHKHHTPSFSIFWRRNMQWWRCHGSCNLEGDVIDLVGFLRVPGYDKRDPDKIRQALEMVSNRYQVVIPQPEPEVKLIGNEYVNFLPPGSEVIQYAATRGLTLETLQKFKIGQFGHYMTMPCFQEKQLLGIKMRNLWACDPKKRFWQLEGSRLGLFNFDAIYLKTGCIWIVKGEIPAMLMDQIGFPLVCSPTGGESSGTKVRTVQKWSEALALSARIVIGDNDIPGREAGVNRAHLFGADLYFPPKEFKDLDQWILADPEGAKKQLRNWQETTVWKWWN